MQLQFADALDLGKPRRTEEAYLAARTPFAVSLMLNLFQHPFASLSRVSGMDPETSSG